MHFFVLEMKGMLQFSKEIFLEFQGKRVKSTINISTVHMPNSMRVFTRTAYEVSKNFTLRNGMVFYISLFW